MTSPTENLRRLWQWHDAEKPKYDDFLAMRTKNLGRIEQEAMARAFGFIHSKLIPRYKPDWVGYYSKSAYGVFDDYSEVYRDLSLTFCAGMEKALEQISAKESEK